MQVAYTVVSIYVCAADDDERIASCTFPFKHTKSFGSQCLWVRESGQAEWLQGVVPLHSQRARTTCFLQAGICHRIARGGAAWLLDILPHHFL